ncbi:MAG: NapH/MauN family ferredoxin-type protein [Epsilonproteobacteria bacterium]|nr:NapH/MauN family ferredoxin-type protein [Campylobacterota bacterium]
MNKYQERCTIANVSFWDTFFVTDINGKKKPSIRFWRWVSIIGFHLLFVLSYQIDIQILEGTISGSRLFGFHLIDPFVTLQVFLAYHHIPTNLILGTVTIVIFYLLFGGRAYCSWICPYGLLSEIGEKINRTLITKKIIKERKFDYRVKYLFWILFASLTFISGYLVFETFNVVGIVSRAIIYGWSAALSFVVIVFLIEVFYSQRAWCRYVCPIGVTYSAVGWVSAEKIEWDDRCDHCGVCINVCLVPHVLEIAKKNADKKGKSHIFIESGDCTLCGRCVEVCHHDCLNFKNKTGGLV